MRSRFDRLRHTVLFEVFGVLLSTPLAAFVLHMEMGHLGIFAIGMATLAMVWNCLYNISFDKLLIASGRLINDRPPWLRALHALGFEFGLLVFAVPGVMWWLELGFVEAIVTDIGFILFYVVYGYLYNWLYDTIFPYPLPVELPPK